jgi:PhnB protein
MAKKQAGKKRPAAKPKKAQAPRPAKKKAAAPKKTRDGGPAGWPTLSPYMAVRDGQKSLEFYARAFGFATTGMIMRDEEGHVQHAGMVLGAAAIMFGPVEGSMGLQPPTGAGPDSLSLYVYVPDVDRLAARATRAGASVVAPPTDQPWQDRTAVFKDPDGYHWTFATHLG